MERKEVIADKRLFWGEPVDVLVFYGHAEKIVELKQWIVHKGGPIKATIHPDGRQARYLQAHLFDLLEYLFAALSFSYTRGRDQYP